MTNKPPDLLLSEVFLRVIKSVGLKTASPLVLPMELDKPKGNLKFKPWAVPHSDKNL